MLAWVLEISRLRATLAELSLALSAFLLALVVVSLVSWTLRGVVPGGLLAPIAGPSATLIAALIYSLLGRARDNEPDTITVPKGLTLGWCLLLVAVGGLAAVVGSFVVGALAKLVGFPVEEQEAILELIRVARARGAAGTIELIVLGIAAVGLAPVAEEWLFRGLLYVRVARVAGPGIGLALSSVAFAGIHLNPAGFVVYLWLGVVFAEVYRRSGRLWTAMLVHAINNALAFGALLLQA